MSLGELVREQSELCTIRKISVAEGSSVGFIARAHLLNSCAAGDKFMDRRHDACAKSVS